MELGFGRVSELSLLRYCDFAEGTHELEFLGRQGSTRLLRLGTGDHWQGFVSINAFLGKVTAVLAAVGDLEVWPAKQVSRRPGDRVGSVESGPLSALCAGSALSSGLCSVFQV